MEIVKYFCDTCKNECLPQEGMGNFTGVIAKMNEKLEKQRLGFSGHYCAKCSEMLLQFISELKNAQNSNSIAVDEPTVQGGSDQRTK